MKKRGPKPIEPTTGQPMRVNVMIDAPTKQTLAQVGHNNVSAGIRILARRHREGKK